MYAPEFKERGQVRAVFVVSLRDTSICSTISREDAEKYGCIWATGVWRRDDEPDLQELLDNDFDALSRAYRRICGIEYAGGAFTYEYRKYKR